MSNHYLLQKNTIRDLTLVIKDKEEEFGSNTSLPLQKRGDITYDFVMDAHEIGKYCFPINIYKAAYDSNNFEEIIDSQIAYNDIFKLHHSKPIIFKEYEEELEATFDYFRSISENVRHKTNSELFRSLWMNYKNISNITDDDTKFKDFAVALSLAYFSFGVERLNEIYPKRLIKESDCGEHSVLNNLVDYHPDEAYINSICKWIMKRKKLQSKNEDALRRDVTSLNKVFFLNNYFIENNINQRLIYFSSAGTTKYILNALKRDAGTSSYYDFNPWRTPIQIYLYLILRELDENNEYIKTLETINNLKGLREQIKDLVDIENIIDKNIVRSEHKSNEIQEALNKKRENYIRKLEKIEGIQLDNIAFLSGIRDEESKKRIQSNIVNYSPNLKTEIMDFLLSTINFVPENIENENDIENLLIQLRTDMKLADVIPLKYSGNEDIITNCYDAFPFLLYIENEDFRSILDSLYEYWMDYYSQTQLKNPNAFDRYKILKIINNFLSLDKDLTTRNQDYYTISALLHLVNSNKSSDLIASSYIKKLEDFGKVEGNSNLLYIKATILRRNGNNEKSIELCNRFKSGDFRFGYCRALALIGLIYEKKAKFDENTNKIKEAISDLKIAFDEIGKSSFEQKEKFQAALCSNIVYLSSLYFHHSDDEKHFHLPQKSVYIKTSEEYLRKLYHLQPKNTWDYIFPDYYHSEAFFEYTTLKAFIDDQKPDDFSIHPKENWGNRLTSALRDVNKAIDFSTVKKKTAYYQELKEKLEELKGKL